MNGRKLNAGGYGRRLIRRPRKNSYRINKGKGYDKYEYVDDGWIQVSYLGKMNVVFSRKNRVLKVRGLVTDDPKISVRQMIHSYNDRGRFEVFFKDCKQLLGLGQYQNGSYEAAVIHLLLVCFAYELLTHVAISREGAKGKSNPAVRLL